MAKSISLLHTFIFLLMAITTAQLIRLDPNKLKSGIRNYLSTIFTALICNVRVMSSLEIILRIGCHSFLFLNFAHH